MPALYALGQHPALLQARAALTPGEDVYAYLDDIYVARTSASIWARRGHGMPRARNPVRYWMRSPPPHALTLGQGVGRGHQPSRASQSWARRWGMPRTSRERCDVSGGSTTNSWVAFPRCHACRAPGSSCSCARSLGAITCSAYCRPLTRESSLSPTTGALAQRHGRALQTFPATGQACAAATPVCQLPVRAREQRVGPRAAPQVQHDGSIRLRASPGALFRTVLHSPRPCPYGCGE